MDRSTVQQIGTIHCGEAGFRVELTPAYAAGLRGMEGFSHVQVFWWFHRCDDARSRGTLTNAKPYVHGPDRLGTFATRSPERPNPIALSCACVTGLDVERGVLHLSYIDADDGSPVLDLKPYTPSLDRVEVPGVPDWCAHWPKSVEVSGDFDWEAEFSF